MRAIVDTGQTQVAVEPNVKIKIPSLDAEVGKEINFDKVMLISDGDNPIVGKPYIEGASVTAEVIAHGKLDKVIVSKYKRRTKYRRSNGHRQQFTEILVKKISH
jgi:large subunit ribosomal protein L21